jgi:hypothetical protein
VPLLGTPWSAILLPRPARCLFPSAGWGQDTPQSYPLRRVRAWLRTVWLCHGEGRLPKCWGDGSVRTGSPGDQGRSLRMAAA